MEALAKHLVEIEKRSATHFNRGELEAILEHFDPDFTGFSSTRRDRISGLRALRRTFEFYRHEAERVEYSISKPEVRAFGGAAVVTFYWEVKLLGTRSGKRRQVIRGRGTHVFVQELGRWKIVHEHFSKATHGPGV